MKENLVMDKAIDFACRIINLHKYLKDKNEHVLSNQIVRSGTSIGANLSEAQHASSKKDFLAKTNIALKECNETKYWLLLLKKTEYISEKEYDSINYDCIELVKILESIVKNIKNTIN